jgi:hypothetical protein
MNKQIMTRYTLGEHRSINLQHGYIDVSDASSESVSIYAGTDAIYDAVAQLLPSCPRSHKSASLRFSPLTSARQTKSKHETPC